MGGEGQNCFLMYELEDGSHDVLHGYTKGEGFEAFEGCIWDLSVCIMAHFHTI